MLINLRNALMAGKRMPTAKDYVQNGLVAMWDGIENAGWGVHDASATTWKDLAGTEDLIFTTTGAHPPHWEDNCAARTTTTRWAVVFATSQNADTDADTVEVVTDFTWYNNDIYPTGLVGGRQGRLIGVANNSQGSSVLFAGYATGKGVPLGSTTKFTASILFSGTGNASVADYYLDGNHYSSDRLETTKTDWNSQSPYYFVIGGRRASDNDCGYSGKIFCVRKYNRALTADEIARNYAIDKARFNLP